MSNAGQRPGAARSAAETPAYRSLASALPAVYRQGDFADRFVSGFDDVLAPIFETLDCLGAYTDPDTAPADFLDWLLDRTGAGLPASVPEEGRRYALRAGVRLQGLRGTRVGLELLVREVLGGQVEISESGGTSRSPWPQDTPGDHETPRAHVRLVPPARMPAQDVVDLVRDWLPAHTRVVIDLVDPVGGG